MNNRITRFYQGLTLTTFTMAVFNTISGLESKKRTDKTNRILEEIRKDNQENFSKLDAKYDNVVETIKSSGDKANEHIDSLKNANEMIESSNQSLQEASQNLQEQASKLS